MKNKIISLLPPKIKLYLDEYFELSKKISPSVFASSLVYYFIIVSIPLINYILHVLSKLSLIDLEYQHNLSGLSLIIFLVNLVYVASKIVHNLKIVSNIIYQKDPSFSVKERIKSVILMIYLFMMMIALIVGEFYLQFFFEHHMFYSLIKNMIIFIFRFLMISFIYSFLLKKIIPVKVKIIHTFKLSLVVTLISYLLIFLYQLFYQLFTPINYQNLYGSIYQLFLFLVLIYFICLVLIYSLIFEFIMHKIKNIEYNNSEHERGV